MQKNSAIHLEKQIFFIPKKNIFQALDMLAKRYPTDGVCCPNFQWRFWMSLLPRLLAHQPTNQTAINDRGLRHQMQPCLLNLKFIYSESGCWCDSGSIKVHLFWEGHKILRNLHLRFDWHYIGQIYSRDFAKFFGLLRIYEL